MRYVFILFLSLFTVFSLSANENIEGVTQNTKINETELTDESKIVVVEKGDTLWDLCEKYLGDPFLWPKIWSINPQIENPHLIEVGDKVKFNTRTGEIKIIKASAINSINKNNGSLSVANTRVFNMNEYHNRNNFKAKKQTLISDKKFRESGKISSSKEDKSLLTKENEVYLTFKHLNKVKIGDEFTIYKIGKKLKHPIRNTEYGYLIDILGEVKITGKTNSKAIAVITDANIEIERGNYVTPKIDLSLDATKTPATKKMNGYIIDFVKNNESVGSKELVFIDRGKADALKKGVIFYIIRDKDPLTGDSVPAFEIGRLIVMSVGKNNSTAFIISAKQNILKGDKITTHKINRVTDQISSDGLEK